MRICFMFTSGKKVWGENELTENQEPVPQVTIPQMIPGQGIIGRVFDYFAVVHTPNENSYLTYVERKSEGTH